jgi:tetratricopeptide (TPR) repeat protein
MNDTLKDLVKIAKTPTQTAALEHFEIARDANRQGLYSEAIDELNFAINGVPGVSAGYRLEWRLHQMMGVIKLGFIDCDLSLVNHPEAEQSFLSAARYAAQDFPDDAANAYLSAGWAAYCQGKMHDAIIHTESAVKYNPKLGEGWFQLAKIHMALGEPDRAFQYLKSAMYEDVGFALKAASDGDFLKHEAELQDFLKGFTENYYRATAAKIVDYLQSHPDYSQIEGIIDKVNEIMEPRTLMEYPQAMDDWYELLSEIKEHCRFRNVITEEIAKAHKKINDLIEVLHSPEVKRMNIVDQTGDLLSQLRAIENLHSCNSIEKTKQCDIPVSRFMLAIKNYAKDVYAHVDRFYDNEIRNHKQEIHNLDNEITEKTKEYEKSYDVFKH